MTVKVDDKEKEIKVPADLKMKRKGKDGTETEVNVSDSFGKMKEGTKLILDVEKDTLKSYKREGKKKEN